MYGSGEFEQNRQNLQNLPSFWAIKNTNFKNMKKKHLPSFKTSVPKIMIICFPVPKLWHVTRCNCYFSFWASKNRER